MVKQFIIGRCIFFCGGLFLCLPLLVSCSVGNYNPKPAIAKGSIKNLETYNTPIFIINAQESTIDHHFGFLNTTVNYHDFTQSVVDAIKNELQSNGTEIKECAQKKLTLKIINVSYTTNGFTYRASINAEVQAGDEEVQSFETSRSSLASGFNMMFANKRPLDSAFKDLVKNILSDTTIQSYLKK